MSRRALVDSTSTRATISAGGTCRSPAPGAAAPRPLCALMSLFLANPKTDVLPIRMWSMLESTLDVRTAAVSGVLIATTALFVFVMDRVAGLTRRLT